MQDYGMVKAQCLFHTPHLLGCAGWFVLSLQIQKHKLKEKLSGIYNHTILDPHHPLMRGFDDTFCIPHSRYTGVREDDIRRNSALEILAVSELAGVAIVTNKSGRQVFVMGHAEYDRDTLASEYFRDENKGINPKVPYNYFPNDDASLTPPMVWRSNATLLLQIGLTIMYIRQHRMIYRTCLKNIRIKLKTMSSSFWTALFISYKYLLTNTNKLI